MQTTARKEAECIQRHQQRHKVLLIVKDQVVLAHNHSDTGPVEPILASLLLDSQTPRAYLAGVRLFDVLAPLNIVWKDIPGYNMRFTNRDRKVFRNDREAGMRGQFYVDYITVRNHSVKKRGPNKRIVPINLELFVDKCNHPKTPEEELELALALLEMCDSRGIEIRSTRGACATMMLRKSAQWIRGRKPAPKFINDISRKSLPGNFYSISAKVEKSGYKKAIPHCYYLDQENAHHSIASTIPLPHPEYIHARGFYRSGSGLWAELDSEIGQQILNGKQVGVVLCKVYIAYKVPSQAHLYPEWALKRGKYNQWIWTPELRLMKDDPRITLGHFVGAFTASRHDPVLREYAKWAQDEILRNERRASYKKGTLLAAYGMLAYRNQGRPIYRFWSNCRRTRGPVQLPLAGLVQQRAIRLPTDHQNSITNVLARGVIESETATRTLEYAKELHALGLHTPQLYADGLLVETDQLPFLRVGWRNKGSRTNVYIPHKNAFISDQEKKLPGVLGGPEEKDWEQVLEEAKKSKFRRNSLRNKDVDEIFRKASMLESQPLTHRKARIPI